jgi:hypothetical protein
MNGQSPSASTPTGATQGGVGRTCSGPGWIGLFGLTLVSSIGVFLEVGAFLRTTTGGPVSVVGPPPPAPAIQLRDVAAEAGVSFRFHTGSRGKQDLPEIMGGGLALIDVDGDHRLDLFFCDGGPIGPGSEGEDPPCRLYRNEGAWRFRDITAQANAPGPSYAMGTAVGDVDGDGLDDLFVTGWRDQRLYRNLGGGRFEDLTTRAGVESREWSTSAAFADLDHDGDLDLYVCNYVRFDPATAPYCAAPDGKRDFCGPEEFPAQPDRLYRNEGGGRFSDVSREAGIALPDGRGLGVLIADLVGDRRLDLFIANDGTACRLFENRGGLRFEEVAAASGVAFDGQGSPLAAMGLGLGDLDGDGLLDLAVSNFLGRSTIAFQAIGRGQFRDASAELGLTLATREVNGFGLSLIDLDGDGRDDMIQANGHVLDRRRLGVPFAMRPTLLRHQGGRLVAAKGAGDWADRLLLGRGLAVGDLDGDDRPDVVLVPLNAPALLLRNQSPGRWLSLDLIGRFPSPPEAIGAQLRATIGPIGIVRELAGGGGYLSTSARRIYLGLGEAEVVDRLEVRWPSGREETWNHLKADRPIRLVEGRSGTAKRP